MMLGDLERTVREPEELMDVLDMAEFHARQSGCDAAPQVEAILQRLRPHVYPVLMRLLREGRLNEVEAALNAFGGARGDFLGLQAVQETLEGMRGLDILRRAVTGHRSGADAQRHLAHAVLALKAALAEDKSGETAKELRLLLLQNLLPKTMATGGTFSADTAMALIGAAFELHLTEFEVWSAVKRDFDALSQGEKATIRSGLHRLCPLWGVSAPAWLLTAELAQCQMAIRNALAGSDLAALQAALLQATL